MSSPLTALSLPHTESLEHLPQHLLHIHGPDQLVESGRGFAEVVSGEDRVGGELVEGGGEGRAGAAQRGAASQWG